MSIKKRNYACGRTEEPNGGGPAWAVSRRDFLSRSYNGLGALALGGMLASEMAAAPELQNTAAINPLAQKLSHRVAKAKHCIFMFMGGGVSHVDSFDYKPELNKLAGMPMPKPPNVSGEIDGKLSFPNLAVPSPFTFKQYGESGRPIATIFPHLAKCADQMAFIYGIEVDNSNHGPAAMHAMTGHVLPGSPSVGAWISYGLGSPSENLPGYVVIQDARGAPINGASTWGNGYLPTTYQGTLLRPKGTPILNLEPPQGVNAIQQRRELDLLGWFNEQHLAGRQDVGELEARISAYELAFRMQRAAPELADLSGETESTQKMYGLDDERTASFGRQCLLARRLVERGVRYTMLAHGVEISASSWDDHGDVEGGMTRHAAEVDRPVAALLRDLAQRGLLEQTLVVWASEMGRTPFHPSAKLPTKPGRDHNPYALAMWMAGGDIAGGATAGATDEFGLRGIGQPIHMRDVHSTILHLMGLDDAKLRYLHGGRFRRLTDIGGRVLSDVIST